MISNSTCSWLTAQTDRPPCTSPIVLACCLLRFALCLVDFTPELHLLVLGHPACCRRGGREIPPGPRARGRHQLASKPVPGFQDQLRRYWARWLQHRGPLPSGIGTGWGSTTDSLPQIPGQAGSAPQTAPTVPGQAGSAPRTAPPVPPSASSHPESRSLYSRSTRFKGRYHRLHASDLNDPPPETPSPTCPVSAGREHLGTGPLNFFRHVALFKNNLHELPMCV